MPDPVFLPAIPCQNTNATSKMQTVRNSPESGKTTSDLKSNAQLEEACSGFESLFIYILLKEMRATIPKSGFMSGGKAEEIYTSIMDSQLAKEISLKGGLGLASIIRDQLTGRSEQVEKPNRTK